MEDEMTKRKTLPKKTLSNLLQLELWEVLGTKPWLDKSGKRLPQAFLKLIAKGWDEKTWKQYLNSFEERDESELLPVQTWIVLLQKPGENIWDFAQETPDDTITKELLSSFTVLPEIHRTVIQMTYWHGMSVREIGRALNISKSLVQRTVKDAERTLRALIKPRKGQFQSSEGSNNFKKERDNDDDISA